MRLSRYVCFRIKRVPVFEDELAILVVPRFAAAAADAEAVQAWSFGLRLGKETVDGRYVSHGPALRRSGANLVVKRWNVVPPAVPAIAVEFPLAPGNGFERTVHLPITVLLR